MGDPADERVLVLAPTPRDAEVSRTVLAEAGVACDPCPDLAAVCRGIAVGAGAAVLTEEALARPDFGTLVETLARQPPWSDLPVLVLTRAGADSEVAVRALETLGNVTLLERPVRVTTLVSAVRAALRARRRQYQLREHLAEARRLTESLTEADKRKDEFLATLAHELRNPLAPIRNALEIMRLVGDDPRAAAPSRQIIERQVDQMVRLVGDLLDVSRITRGKVTLYRVPLDLAEAVRDAVETSRPVVEAGGHELVVVLPPEPVRVDGDSARLAQVVANLLNNAAKYTPDGGRIRVSVGRDAGGAVVCVTDTGVGIPAHMLVKVFDPFIQVDRTLDRAQGGLGIGLTLVKSLVEMHGGTVEARSDGPGAGSEFVVRLPLLPAATPGP